MTARLYPTPFWFLCKCHIRISNIQTEAWSFCSLPYTMTSADAVITKDYVWSHTAMLLWSTKPRKSPICWECHDLSSPKTHTTHPKSPGWVRGCWSEGFIKSTLDIVIDITLIARKEQRKLQFNTPLLRNWDQQSIVGILKLKSTCTLEEIVIWTKRQPSEWEKSFARRLYTKNLKIEYVKNLKSKE